ncbi:Membrane associated serine protease, rhomboid family [Candidatus Kryptobacter tengchongensis]|uniref:Membrane associated serine protease, rhomboid family n=1 Tax=Kryptobacter tengchongensis TaxID=1643429 RepID=A0A656D2C7_KRYT1|nr:rhomboid family intramembrane serine protease [Candidatus Kryptobacter tengchongensis]CUS97750.1 Membrane associated serine protease, rhomboid family [Candidatus Kryptobacter tengchongensis]CUU08817.1 Membrane associated serine protease, rhomboid family [Candidatus Kryptobacter tengchongensis]
MIPLKDTIPSQRYPIVTVTLIILNVFAFLFELSLGEDLSGFFDLFGVVPATYFELKESGAPFWLIYYPFLTSMFLHGGWMHLIGNMIYLWVFGDNVEDRMGHLRFFVFYILCGVFASFAHVYTNPHSEVPAVGASGAISGVLGAYFLLFPHSRVITLIPIFFFFDLIEVSAFVFLGLWFLIQFFNGVASLGAATYATSGGVAWWAHIGGFVAGFLLSFAFIRRGRY